MLELAGYSPCFRSWRKYSFRYREQTGSGIKTRIERRNPAANYHVYRTELTEWTPHFDWSRYLQNRD